MTKGRRQIRFTDLPSAAADAQALLAHGHRTVGRWTLAQICNHLSATIGYSVDGYPGKVAPWVLQVTIGRTIRSLMFATEKIAQGMPLPAVYRPSPTLDDAEQVAALREMVDRFSKHPGPWKMHPMIGSMTRAQWETFHRIHCAHHLSFVVPE